MISSMTQAVADNGVHIGVWTNWSRGAILGATLTLNHSDGGFLTAFLALFVTITGTCFWRIACFTLHFVLSTQESRDGLYHQQQAILRNAATSTGGLYRLFTITWTWRGTANRIYARILPLLAATTLIISGFAVASIFSSKISTLTGNEVLLAGDNCFVAYNSSSATINEILQQFNPYKISETTAAYTYAQQCYRDKGGSKDCSTMIQKTLPMTIDQHADCPFYDGICLSNSSNLKIDTGHMNSHEHLGINAPPQDRFSYRSVLHCAPIKTEGYHVFSHSPDSNNSGIHTYYYGRNSMSVTGTNETTSFMEYPRGTSLHNDFVLSIPWNFTTMIPQLQRQDATTDIFFLSAKELSFLQPVDDRWYSAHMRLDIIIEDANGRPLESGVTYLKDEFMTVLACATNHQFCNPNLPAKSGCLPLQGTHAQSAADKESAGHIWGTDNQWASARFMSNEPYSNGVGRVVIDLGAFSLLSHASSSAGLVPPLADNQWQLDVQHWFNTTLAILQRRLIEQATGPSNELASRMAIRPKTDAEWARCRNQKVKSTEHTSFSVLGLSLTLSIGILIIATSYGIEPLTILIQKRRNMPPYQRIEWTMNKFLQLQRLAHEELGYGTWHNADGDVPTTNPGEKLARLDLTDLEHPTLAVRGDEKVVAPSLPPPVSSLEVCASHIPVPPCCSSAHASRRESDGDLSGSSLTAVSPIVE